MVRYARGLRGKQGLVYFRLRTCDHRHPWLSFLNVITEAIGFRDSPRSLRREVEYLKDLLRDRPKSLKRKINSQNKFQPYTYF
jgi:hypothetical protein